MNHTQLIHAVAALAMENERLDAEVANLDETLNHVRSRLFAVKAALPADKVFLVDNIIEDIDGVIG